MAGDWIKMRSALLSNPKVHTIARLVGECRDASRVLTTGANCPPCEVLSRNALRNVTVTALLLVWSSANEHTSDGVMRCCDLIDIDEIAGIPGFGEAMQYVGWALHDDEKDAIILPNFTEWNTPAKDRTAAERQRRFREKRNGNVTRDSNGRVRGREEVEEEEEDPPLPPKGESAEEQTAVGEPPKEPPPADVPPEPSPQFPECVRDICEEWLEYKRQRNHKYKPMGLKKLVTQVEKALTKYGPEVVRDGIEKAIANNYQGWTFCVSKQQPASKPVTFAQQAQANMAAIISKAAAADAAAGRITGQQALLEGYSE
jgi:hypothetical protein